MTWDQVQLFADKAGERVAQDLMATIGGTATSIGVALSGDTEPLKRMARELGTKFEIPVSSGADGDSSKLTNVVRDLASTGQVRIVRGPDSRGAERRARRPHARVPRGTPTS